MKVTIGLPFRDASATLGAAIASVRNQTYPDWELLLLDDGSTDGSVEVARTALGDRRVRLLVDGQQRGLAARLNQLAAAAGSEALARMDADDLMHPERLARQLKCLYRTGADVTGTSAYVFDERLRVVGVRRAAAFRTRADVLRRGGFIHPSCLGRTGWFRRNPYSEHHLRAEDLELWARTVESSRFTSLDEPLHFYREPRPPNLCAFRQSWATARSVLLQHGRGALGSTELWARAARPLVAELLYRGAAPFPFLSRALLDRRNARLTLEERRSAEELLARAMRPPPAGAC